MTSSESMNNNQAESNGERSKAFLTVEEAAEYLGISRNTAYLATKRYRATGGREGLPVIKIGGCLRVPRAALERMAREGLVEFDAA